MSRFRGVFLFSPGGATVHDLVLPAAKVKLGFVQIGVYAYCCADIDISITASFGSFASPTTSPAAKITPTSSQSLWLIILYILGGIVFVVVVYFTARWCMRRSFERELQGNISVNFNPLPNNVGVGAPVMVVEDGDVTGVSTALAHRWPGGGYFM